MTQVPEKIHSILAHLLVTEFFLCSLKYFSVIYHTQDKTDVTNINKKSASPPNQSDLFSPLSCSSVGGLDVGITYSICVFLGVPCDVWNLPQQCGSHSAHAYGSPLEGRVSFSLSKPDALSLFHRGRRSSLARSLTSPMLHESHGHTRSRLLCFGSLPGVLCLLASEPPTEHLLPCKNPVSAMHQAR